METAQLEDPFVVFFGVLEAVVAGGEALLGVDQVAGAVLVELFADGFELGNLLADAECARLSTRTASEAPPQTAKPDFRPYLAGRARRPVTPANAGSSALATACRTGSRRSPG